MSGSAARAVSPALRERVLAKQWAAPVHGSVLLAFSDVSDALSTGGELVDILHLIARQARALVGTGRCNLYLREAESGLFRGQVTEGPDLDDHVRRLACGSAADRFTAEILAHGAPVVIDNAQNDPRPIRATMRSWKVRSILGVPMMAGGQIVGLLFFDDPDERHTFSAQIQLMAAEFATLAGGAAVQAARAKAESDKTCGLMRQNRLLRSVVAGEDRLIKVALDCGSLAEIVATLAEILDKPCSLHDGGFRRLADGRPVSREAPVPRLLDSHIRCHPQVERALATLSIDRPTVLPAVPDAGMHHRTLINRFAAGPDQYGYLTVLEFGSGFAPTDPVVLRRAAMIIALQLAGHGSACGSPANQRAALVRETVSSSPPSKSLVRRAEFEGLRATGRHVVAVIEPRVGTLDESTPEELDSVAHASGAGEAWVAAMPEGTVVVLLELDPNQPDHKAIREAVRRVELFCGCLTSAFVYAGLSKLCHGPADFRRGFDEASQVLRCINRFSGATDQTAVVSADALGPARVVLAATDRSEADRFVSNVLGGLLHGRGQRRDHLLATLSTYFDCSRGVRETAAQLMVHENTVRYRLSRIVEITGGNVMADPNHQLELQIALLVLRLQGRLPGAAQLPQLQTAISSPGIHE